MPKTQTWISWYVALTGYVIAAIVISLLTLKEWRKRLAVRKLSRGGTDKQNAYGTSLPQSSPTVGPSAPTEDPKSGTQVDVTSRDKSSQSSRSRTLQPTAGGNDLLLWWEDRLSYLIYFFAFTMCLTALFRFVPQFCEYTPLILLYFVCGSSAKVAFVAYLYHRYFSCFVIDQKHYKTSQSGARMRCLLWTAMTLSVTGFGGLVTWLVNFAGLGFTLYDGLWCTSKGLASSWEWTVLIATSSFLVTWCVLVLYTITILTLSKKITKSMGNRTAQLSTSTQPKSVSYSSAAGATTIARQNSLAKQSSTVMNLNNKLKTILTRILICAGVSQLVFTVSQVIDGIDGQFTAVSHVAVAIDMVSSVYFTNLMMQHNTEGYLKFLKYLKCIFRCCACCDNAYKLALELQAGNVPRAKVIAVRNVTQQNKANGGQKEPRASATPPPAESQTKDPQSAGIEIEKSYRTSEVSKDDTGLGDAYM